MCSYCWGEGHNYIELGSERSGHIEGGAGRGVLERVSAVGFCQEMAVVAAISQVKDCYKILKHIILPMYTN